MGSGTVTITPDQAPSQSGGAVTITPDAPSRGFLANLADKLPGTPDTGLKGAVSHMGDTWNAVGKPIADVSAPVIAGELYKRFTGQANDLKALPGKMVTAFALSGEPGAEGDMASPRPAASAETAGVIKPALGKLGSAASTVGQSLDPDLVGLVSPRAAHALRLASKIGKVATNLGTEAAPEAAVEASVPEFWGKGQYGTPIDQWGQRIPERGSIAGQMADSVAQPPTPAPMRRGSLSQMMNSLQDQVGKGLGAAPPPNPTEPIYPRAGSIAADIGKWQPPPELGAGNAPDYGQSARAAVQKDMGPLLRGTLAKQMASPSEDLTPMLKQSLDKATAVPEGHTPVESKALKSYKYDPNTREFHAQYNSNPAKIHIFGDVSPEEAQAFEAASSKGTAMQAIRRNPEVARIVKGKRVAVKPGVTQ